MNNSFDFTEFFEVFRRISEFHRPSNSEVVFATNLLADLDVQGDREVIYKETNGHPDYVFVRPRGSQDYVSPYVFVAHMDEEISPSTKTFAKHRRSTLYSHNLDDSVSVALLRYMLKHWPLQVLFTTKEEVNKSWEQLQEIYTLYGLRPIAVDVSYVSNYELVLPDADFLGPLDVSLMSFMSSLSGIPLSGACGATEVGVLGAHTHIRGGAIVLGIKRGKMLSKTGDDCIAVKTIEQAHQLILKLAHHIGT